jgi:hypothetical protein
MAWNAGVSGLKKAGNISKNYNRLKEKEVR